jgi:hypothetical protein
MIAGLGHNNGPSMEPGQAWRTHAWAKARKALLPTLPIEVVRLRVRRAKELGLPYKTYAGIRASTGHDLVGFLFSSNALGKPSAHAVIPDAVTQKLVTLEQTTRVALVHKGIDVARIDGLDRIEGAPAPHLTWSAMRDRMKAIAVSAGHPADRWVLVGETMFERDWAAAAQTAGFLTGTDYFAPSANG